MPDIKNTYYRNFLIFEKEDHGFGDGAEPTGYIKLEGREGKGKLSLSVQNLREAPGKAEYKLYLIFCNANIAISVFTGCIPLQRGRGELKWDFDTVNVAHSGIPIFDFNAAVIVAEIPDRSGSKLVCPLAAYKGEKVNWRGRILLESQAGKAKETSPVELKGPEFDEEVLTKQEEFPQMDYGYNTQQMEYGYNTQQMEYGYNSENIVPEEELGAEAGSIPESNKATEGTQKQEINYGNPTGPQASQANSENTYADSYAKDQHNTAAQEKTDVQDIEKLKKSFDKYFEVFDPFNSKRRDYKWWKVDSPVNLNNILYQCNIRSPLLFNPIVMMAHFKFRHLAIGLYTDKSKEREYLVCGVPGVYGIDTRPFGDMCRWIQLEGNTQKYGAFGYWIVFVDPGSGRFLGI